LDLQSTNEPLGRVRIKICGITRVEDALAAARLGADAIGLVFYAKSPRAVTVEAASDIVAELPPFIAKVGLFVNAPEEEVKAVLGRVPLDVLQFHGNENPDDCAGYGRPHIKAFRVREGMDLHRLAKDHAQASAFLLDSFTPGLWGGSGQSFDWSLAPQGVSKPLILAGGLTPDNVAEAIAAVRPYAVDVSGGVEKSKGVKDVDKMRAFIEGVRNAKY
jgi:phosphoribosylanthranilate isomerase